MANWIKNAWYAIARQEELTLETQPLKKTALGQDFVLFIDHQRNYAALTDLCPHMGAAFSLGAVENGEIICPYHRLAFGSDGACKSAPGCRSDKPPRAFVDSYPVEERYGLLWIYIGDQLDADRPPIIGINEFDDPSFRRLYYDFVWNASVEAVFENFADLTHFSYLHFNTFGNKDRPFQDTYKVHYKAFEVECSVEVGLNPNNWFLPDTGEYPDVKVRSRFHLPTNVVNEFSLGDHKDVTLFAITPIDESSVLIRMYGCRNFETTPEADARLAGLGERILAEDRDVVESCKPEVLPYQVNLPVDRYMIALRKLYTEYRKKNSARSHVFKTDSGKNFTVVPSSVRIAHPELAKSWQSWEDVQKYR